MDKIGKLKKPTMAVVFLRNDVELGVLLNSATSYQFHTGQCKRTDGCYNELVVAFYSIGGGVKGKKNLYLLTLLFIYKLAFILFVMTPGTQTTGNIAVYGSAKQLVI